MNTPHTQTKYTSYVFDESSAVFSCAFIWIDSTVGHLVALRGNS